MKRTRFGGLCVVLALAVTALLTGGCKPNQSTGPAPTYPAPLPVVSPPGPVPVTPAKDKVPGKQEPAIVVTAEQLTRDYAKDTEAAKKRYEEKLVEIEDTVRECGYRTMGHARVRFDGFEPLKWVQCWFAPASGEQADRLTVGQKVKVRGKCYGQAAITWLTNCEIVEAGPDPAVAVKLLDLVADYAMGTSEADKKYKGKQLVVEAVLADVITTESGFKYFVLGQPDGEKPAKAVKVKATRHVDWIQEYDKLTKGQKLKVKGPCDGISQSEPGVVQLLECVLVK